MTEPDTFLQLEFYYPVLDSDAGVDVSGDQIITDMLAPLVDGLKATGTVTKFEFMRYSVGGYHLRAKLRGPREKLEAARRDLIPPQVEAYRVHKATELKADMVLGDFSRKLCERLELDPADLRPGGHLVLSYAREQEGLYEDPAMHEAYVGFSDMLCATLVVALRVMQDVRTRKTFVRLLLADLIAACGMKANELYYVLGFIKRQWEIYFSIEAGDVLACRQSADTLAPRFHAFLDSRDSPAQSARALPPDVRAFYALHARSLAQAMPGLIRRESHGGIGNNTALRLLSLVHLTHNRMGLDIAQELLFTELLGRYYRRSIPEDEAHDSDSWVERNIEQYMSQEHNVVY